MQTKKNKNNTEIELKHLDKRNHVLHRPDMYIGSITSVPTDCLTYDFKTDSIVKKKFLCSPALERIFIEILSNAGDHSIRSRQTKYPPGEIEVTINSKRVTIKNYGKPFHIKKFEDTEQYEQELAFGKFNTSTNYNDDLRVFVAGTNGFGAKGVNTWSTYFKIRVIDEKLKYEQEWFNNMSKVNPPVISKNEGNLPPSVEVIYEADFSKFKMDGYGEELIGYFAFHCINLSFNCKIPIIFNNKRFFFPNIVEYGEFITGGDLKNKNYIVFTENEKGKCSFKFNRPEIKEKNSEVKKTNGEAKKSEEMNGKFEKGETLEKDNKILKEINGEGEAKKSEEMNGKFETLEKDNKILKEINGEVENKKKKIENTLNVVDVLIYDTPDKKNILSFANAILTSDGGVHVNAIMKKIKEVVIPSLNSKLKDEENKKYRLNLRDLKPHISMIISCYLKKPEIKGQMKSYLSAPTPNIKITKKNLEEILNWNLIKRLDGTIKAKQFDVLASTDGKNTRKIFVSKALDANKAGTKESHKCILYITEGDSAMNYVKALFEKMKGKDDYVGIFPLRGKVINVLKHSNNPIKLNKNKEYVRLKKILGLKEGVDYKNKENVKRDLRYGKVKIAADSDVDGKHITGLNISNLYAHFKSILEEGMVKMLRTPVVRASKGKLVKKFFNIIEFEDWAKTVNITGWAIKYCKGLGSSNNTEIQTGPKDNVNINFVYDDKAEEYINLAFNVKNEEKRKKWLNEYQPYRGIEKIKNLDISLFIDKELIEYSIYNNIRCIPGLDGLKTSQRKVLYTALYKWGKEKAIKTISMANRASEFTNYHHNPDSLSKAINGMVTSFVGSNNLPYFASGAQFGTRYKNGKDAAAPRYTTVEKQWWWDFVYISEDVPIYQYVFDEGKQSEPIHLLPIIPMMLINGANGIGTGWATYIPNYNPLDICTWLINKIEGKKNKSLIPWWRDFKGTVKVTVSVKNVKTGDEGEEKEETFIDKNILEPDVVDYDEDSLVKRRVVTQGIYKEYGPNKVVIEELPIQRSIESYINWLGFLRSENKIKDFKYIKSQNDVNIEIFGFKNPSVKNLRLVRSFGLTSMVLLDSNNRPHNFKTVEELLEYWYEWRLSFYPKRINKTIELKEKEVFALKQKEIFVEAFILGTQNGKIKGKTIVIIRETDESVRTQMQDLSIPYEIYTKTRLSSCTEGGLKEIIKKYKNIEDEIEKLRKVKPEDIWLKELQKFVSEYNKNMK